MFTTAFSPCIAPGTSLQEAGRVATPGKHSSNFWSKLFAPTGKAFAALKTLNPANIYQEKEKCFLFLFLHLIISSLLFFIKNQLKDFNHYQLHCAKCCAIDIQEKRQSNFTNFNPRSGSLFTSVTHNENWLICN